MGRLIRDGLVDAAIRDELLVAETDGRVTLEHLHVCGPLNRDDPWLYEHADLMWILCGFYEEVLEQITATLVHSDGWGFTMHDFDVLTWATLRLRDGMLELQRKMRREAAERARSLALRQATQARMAAVEARRAQERAEREQRRREEAERLRVLRELRKGREWPVIIDWWREQD